MVPFKKVSALSVLAVSFLLSGCSPKQIFNDPLPTQEIVFQVNDSRGDSLKLGFINPDGSDLLYYTPIREDVPSIYAPVWTNDSQWITFRNPGDRTLQGIDSNGYLHPYGGFGLGERPSPLINSQEVAVLIIGTEEAFINRVNLQTGQVIETYFTETVPGLSIGTNIINNDRLVYTRGWLVNEYNGELISELVLFDLKDRHSKILLHQQGINTQVNLNNPAFSPDGKWIAYTAADGIYIISPTGGEPHRIIEHTLPNRYYFKHLERAAHFTPHPYDIEETWFRIESWPPMASWSPDSRWIVYHRCMLPFPAACTKVEEFNIYKVDIETGEEVLLVEGGLNPYWRLAP